MSYQVDQVEITPVTSAPEHNIPGGVMGILAKIRGLFDASKAPPAQSQVSEITDEPEWNEYTALEALRELSEPLSVEQFFELAEKSSWNTHYVYQALEKLRENLSLQQVLKLIVKSSNNYDVVNAAFGKLDRKISFDEFFGIAEQTNWNINVFCEALKAMDETLSFEQVLEIVEKSERDYSIIHYAFEKFEGTFSSDKFFEIAAQSDWDYSFVNEALKKLRGTLSFDQIMVISEKSDWDSDITIKTLAILDGPLSVDQFTQIAEKSNREEDIVYAAFEKINGSLTVDQFLEIIEKSGWNYQVLLGASEKINGPLSVEQFTQIAEGSKWEITPVFSALKKIDESLSVGHVLKIVENTGGKNKIIREALKKMDGAFSIEQVFHIAKKSNWDYHCTVETFRKLEKTLSIEQFLDIAKKSRWNSIFVLEAIKKLDGALSLEQVLEITEKAEVHYSIIREVFKKLDGALLFDQVLKIAEKSGRDDSVLCEALKKVEGTLSLEQVLIISEKSKMSGNTVREAFKKLDRALSLDLVFEIAEQMHWNAVVVTETLMQLDGALSNGQVFEIAEKSNWKDVIVCQALKKLKGTLSLDQFFEIAEQSKWYAIVVYEALKKLKGTLSFDQFFEITENTERKMYVFYEAFEKLGEALNIELVLEIIKNKNIAEVLTSKIISRLFADNPHTSLDYTELISELAQKYPGLLLIYLEKFKVLDSIQIAITLIENDNYGLVVEHLSHFPQKDWAEIVKLLMQNNRFHHKYLTSLLPYIDYIDEQTKKDIFSKLLQSPDNAFFPELLENETPRAVGQFGSFGKEEQLTKLAQLKEGRFYKALLVLSKAYGYSAEQIGFTFENILSEVQILINHANYAHLFDLISLALLLFPEKEIELQNIRETFSSENSSPTEQPQPRETFVQFDALKEIFEYYAMITLAGRYTIDLLPHSLTSRITDKINTLYEKIKEYIVIAVSSELEHSSDFKSRMFGNHGNFLYKFGTPEDIRVFFERAKIDFPKEPNYPNTGFGGPSWATIADFGAQFWADSAQNDLSIKITLLNLAVSLQHNTGYFFDKDNRVKLENQELTKLLDFEAGGERTFESFLEYGLENNLLNQEEYDEYLLVNNKLSSATEQLPTRVDSNQIYLRQMVQEAKKQIEAIQNNPTIPFEIKMEAQAVFSKTEGFSRKENYRFYLSNLLKTISINWENIDDTIKRFQSGNQVIYSVSIAGYDLAYWYEDGKLMTIHSMDELKQQRQKLSQFLNQPIVAAQFGYVREGD